MRLALVLLLFVACGGGPEGEPGGTTGEPSGDEPTAGGDVEPAGGPAAGAVSLAIDGEQVDRATFEALRGRLRIDEDAAMSAELAAPDGGYGGFEAVYDAVDADGIRYRLTVVEQHGDGAVHRSESLDRVSAE